MNMKKQAVFTLVIIMGLFGCSSQKKLTKDTPFSVEGPSCQLFSAGREEGGTGFVLKFPLSGDWSNVSFQKIYFRGHLLEPNLLPEEGDTVLVCEYKKATPDGGKGIIMHADPMEEVGNQPPPFIEHEPEEFPFDLSGDEAVIEFLETGKKKPRYVKVAGIKEKLPLQYPSRPKN